MSNKILGGTISAGYRKLAKSSSVVILTRVAAQSVTFLTAILLARLLGADGYGIYAFALAVLSLLGMVVTLGLPGYLIREVARARADGDFGTLRHLMSKGMRLSFTAAIICASAAGALVFAFLDIADQRIKATLVALVALVPLALAAIFTSTLSGLGHPTASFSMDALVRPVVMLVAATVIFVWLPGFGAPIVIIWVQVAASVVLCGLAFLILRPKLPAVTVAAQASSQKPPKVLRNALPFLALSGVAFVNNQTDILMLGLLRPAEDVGVYRVAVQMSAVVAFGLNALNVVLAPQIAHSYKRGDREKLRNDIARSTWLSFLVGIAPALLLLGFGGSIAVFVFGSEFTMAATPISILVFGQMINVAMGPVGYIMTMTCREKTAMHVLAGAAFLNVALNASLIPIYGMVGAAIATAVSLCVWNFTLAYLVWKDLKINSTIFGTVAVGTANK